ncbi:MAG TPA: lysophospholipid acyltransferase family protein, partial [Rhizomicrobium sp.]|nr:lysophospholipid acyltransferase family protein [Rhizomicrobium sp.]
MIFLRSVIFFLWFAVMSAVINIAALPALLLPRRVTVWVSRNWSRLTLWGLRVFCGLRYEVRGAPPPPGTLIASKHMSMWDTVALYLLIDDPAVVLKRQLLWVPFYGWYVWKAGSIAIDRDGGASSLRKMAAASLAVIAKGRSIMIFPEGTRKLPGTAPDYKPGVAGLYTQLNVPCVPVALNSALFWSGPAGFLKKPGKIVVEYLEPIPPGMPRKEFMALLQARIEAAT